MRMRALDRWSAVSLAMTAPSPVHGEPRRPADWRRLGGTAGLLEIARINLVETRGGEVDAEQIDLRGEAACDVGAQVALAVDAVALGTQRLHPHHPGYRGKSVGNVGAARLDIDDVAAAEHLAGQLGHRAGQRDAAAVEQRHPVAHALHLVEVMRG